MSQAAQYAPAGPEQPVKKGGRARLFLVPLAVLLLLLLIPAGAFAFSQNELSQAQRSKSSGAYGQALSQYATVQSVAGNPVARVVLGDLAGRAQSGTAETHFLWGLALNKDGKFAEAEAQFREATSVGLAEWATRANGALADLFAAWAQSLVAKKQFQTGIDKYKLVATVDPTGNLTGSTNAGLAAAYAAFAQWYTQQEPADYPNALIWYQNLVKEFPDSAEARLAKTSFLPQTLYNAGLAFVQQMRYQQARDAMTDLITNYPSTTWAPQANTAMHADQPLTGQLVLSDQTPTPIANRLVRIATHWKIVKPHTYDDSGGKIYQATTDATGNFKVMMPPGQNYLITWWDPSRSTFVTTFLSDNMPVNLITINALEPAHTTVATS